MKFTIALIIAAALQSSKALELQTNYSAPHLLISAQDFPGDSAHLPNFGSLGTGRTGLGNWTGYWIWHSFLHSLISCLVTVFWILANPLAFDNLSNSPIIFESAWFLRTICKLSQQTVQKVFLQLTNFLGFLVAYLSSHHLA